MSGNSTTNPAGDRVLFKTTGGATQELEYDAQGNIAAAEDLYNKREQTNGSHDLAFNKDLYTAKEILEILQRKEAGWEKLLEEKLFFGKGCIRKGLGNCIGHIEMA